jgi:hypothetical protein
MNQDIMEMMKTKDAGNGLLNLQSVKRSQLLNVTIQGHEDGAFDRV